jgi:hypothetical protein
MLLNKGNALCTVKCQAGAVVPENVRRSCECTGYERLFNAVLGACGSFVDSGKFASCLSRQSGPPSCGLMDLACRPLWQTYSAAQSEA